MHLRKTKFEKKTVLWGTTTWSDMGKQNLQAQNDYCNLVNECKIKRYVDLIQKKYISYWNHTLQHSQKLNFYYKIKTNYSLLACLDLTRKNPSRKTF